MTNENFASLCRDLINEIVSLSKMATEIKMQNKMLIEKMDEHSKIDTALFSAVQRNIDILNKLTMGNGDPKKGHSYRIAKLEEEKEDRKKHVLEVRTTLGLVVATVVADWIIKIYHH
jgi:hypothetical protein